MGEVYAAYDDRLARTVALKRVQLGSADEDSVRRQRFRREARLAAGLSHPSIVRIHDILEDRGEDWLVMEYLEGRTLAQVLETGPLAEGQALTLASQIVAGLGAAHARGIIHRDLKRL